MNKVYLLLRKNQQTGPYTYEELLQQQLSTTDLIWVEGKTTAWITPSELEVFQKEQSQKNRASKKNQAKQVSNNITNEKPWYISKLSPEAELEQRALAIREQAQATAIPKVHSTSLPSLSTHKRHPKHTFHTNEEPSILLEVHTANKKNVSLPQLVAAGVITALIATGWYNRHLLHIVRPQQNEVTQAAAPALFQVILPPAPKRAPVVVAVADTVNNAKDSMALAVVATTPVAKPAKPIKIPTTDTKALVREIPTPPLVAKSTAEGKKEQTVTETSVVATAKNEKEVAVEANTPPTTEASMDPMTAHKKKGLGQALKNIFKKKKKDDDNSDSE